MYSGIISSGFNYSGILKLFTSFASIFAVDCSFHLVTNILKLNYIGNIQTARWFYIHSIVNFIIMYYSVSDIKLMFNNITNISNLKWTYNSEITFIYACLLHFYHILFFRLNNADKLHHFYMLFICAPLTYMTDNVFTSFALFFLTGLPGFIDYALLYFVKLGILDSITEKYVYILITTWVRNPGCTMCVILAFIILKQTYDKLKLIYITLSTFITFVNGNYYLMVTYFDYFDKLNKLNKLNKLKQKQQV